MTFEPTGGFPPLIDLEEENQPPKINERGFASIVDISSILNAKKKQDLTMAFGETGKEESEGGGNINIHGSESEDVDGIKTSVRLAIDTEPYNFENNPYE